jgi:hypothetical protein
MYEPVFNSVLVQIDDKDAEWGTGNDDSMLGKSYSKGTVIRIGNIVPTDNYSCERIDWVDLGTDIEQLVGKQIMWNEGVEAGTVFEFDGKAFGMIYWWDIRGVLVNDKDKAK